MSQRDDQPAVAKMILSSDEEFARIKAAIRSIQFREVRVIIQGGVVVQIERVERERLR